MGMMSHKHLLQDWVKKHDKDKKNVGIKYSIKYQQEC